MTTAAWTAIGVCIVLAIVLARTIAGRYMYAAGSNTVLAGIVVGGTCILGGEGAIWRTVVGVLFIAVIGNGFTLLGWNPLYEQITLGVILLLAWAATPGPGCVPGSRHLARVTRA